MMLGVIVGVAALTALASVGEATRQETMRQFKRMLGTFDTLTVRPGAGSTRGMPSLGLGRAVAQIPGRSGHRRGRAGGQARCPRAAGL